MSILFNFWKKFFEFAFCLQFPSIAQSSTLKLFLGHRALILNKHFF